MLDKAIVHPPSLVVLLLLSCVTMDRKQPTTWMARYAMRLRMVLFFVGAVAVMIINDRFFAFLDQHPLSYAPKNKFLNFFVYYDRAVANFMTAVAKGFLAATLGVAFGQFFWMQTRRRQFNVPQISDSLACKDSPVRSAMTIRTTFMYSIITLLSISLVFITIIAPGAMSYQDKTLTNNTCEQETVNMGTADIAVAAGDAFVYQNPAAQARGFVAKVLLNGEPLAPLINYDPSGNTTYNITFSAPSLECTDITESVNFTTALPDPASDGDVVVVWNAALTYNSDKTSVNLTVASRGLFVGPSPDFTATPGTSPEAVTCTPYVSEYAVEIQTAFTTPLITITSRSASSPISPSASDNDGDGSAIQFYALVDSLFGLLRGVVSYDPSTFDFTPSSPIVAYSPMVDSTPDTPWNWTEHMSTALPNLMENVSLSILSDLLSESGHPSLENTTVSCRIEDAYYIYNHLRFFLTYGIGLSIGALGVVLGFYSVHLNGREESLEFGLIYQFVTNRGAILVEEKEKGGLGYDPLLVQVPSDEKLV